MLERKQSAILAT